MTSPNKISPPEGEEFEARFFGIIVFKCRKFTVKGIIALILILLFVFAMVKL